MGGGLFQLLLHGFAGGGHPENHPGNQDHRQDGKRTSQYFLGLEGDGAGTESEDRADSQREGYGQAHTPPQVSQGFVIATVGDESD